MVRQLTREERQEVFNLWMSAFTYREISQKTGVSTGAITNVIEAERKKIPELDQLRQLRKNLIKEDIPVIDAVRGAAFCKKLDDLNLSLIQLQQAIKIVEVYGDKSGEVIEAGQRLKELEQLRGKRYDDILLEYDEKTNQLYALNNQLGNLKKQIENSTSSLNEIERLKVLNEKMKKLNLTINRLDDFLEAETKLEEMGFTLNSAELLGKELFRIGFNPQSAAKILAEALLNYKNLSEAVTKLAVDGRRFSQLVEDKKEQEKDLILKVEHMQEQLKNFRTLISNEESLHQRKLRQIDEEVHLLEEKYEKTKEEIARQKEIEKTIMNEVNFGLTNMVKIEEKIKRVRPLLVYMRFVEKSYVPIDKFSVLTTCMDFVEGLMIQLKENPEFKYSSRFFDLCEALRKYLEGELKLAGTII